MLVNFFFLLFVHYLLHFQVMYYVSVSLLFNIFKKCVVGAEINTENREYPDRYI